jgi:NAD-specific glutamate dehydrogenase
VYDYIFVPVHLPQRDDHVIKNSNAICNTATPIYTNTHIYFRYSCVPFICIQGPSSVGGQLGPKRRRTPCLGPFCHPDDASGPVLLSTLNKSGYDTSGSLDTKGKRGNFKEEKVLSLLRCVTGKNGSLNGSTIRNSFIRVDNLVRLLAVEEVGNKFDDTRDTSGTTDQHDFVDARLVDLGVTEDLLDRFKSTTEEILAQLFEMGTS